MRPNGAIMTRQEERRGNADMILPGSVSVQLTWQGIRNVAFRDARRRTTG